MTLSRAHLAVATTVVAALFAIVGMSSLAAAAVTPSVTATIRNGSNTVITSAPVSTQVHAFATVASSSASTSPIGTVNFSLYSNQNCSGAPLTQVGVALVNGSAQSSTTTVPIGGLSYIVHYTGQGDLYTSANSPCVSIAATQSAPALSLSLSNSNVQAGSFVYAIPNLTNETSDADGTIKYRVFSNNTCTNLALEAGTKTVTNGNTSNSDTWQFITPGTYYWQGVYSGDADNAVATSSCTGAVLTVVATTTTPAPTTPGSISGTVFNDLNKDGDQDSGEPGLSGWKVWLHQKATTTAKWWKNNKKWYKASIVMTATTDANGNYSFANLTPGTYFIEQEEPKGWNQKTPDKKVTLDNSTSTADVDFANVEKKKQNDNNNGSSDNDKEKFRQWFERLFNFWWDKRNS